jgi:hypothetical protein
MFKNQLWKGETPSLNKFAQGFKKNVYIYALLEANTVHRAVYVQISE